HHQGPRAQPEEPVEADRVRRDRGRHGEGLRGSDSRSPPSRTQRPIRRHLDRREVMSIEVKVGQVWRDKDKRRNTVIEILSVPNDMRGDAEVIGLVVGTEDERSYRIDRLQKRWEMVTEKSEEPEIFEWDGKGSMRTLAEHAHIHTHGECVKNRD